MKMSSMVFDLVVLFLWLPLWFALFSFLHVSTLWFIIPKFVQYFSLFPILVCVYVGVAYLVFCGTKSALLASTTIMPSSHNIIASLCYCNVDRFILTIVIMRYDYNPALNTIVRKLYVVSTCKPWASFWIHS